MFTLYWKCWVPKFEEGNRNLGVLEREIESWGEGFEEKREELGLKTRSVVSSGLLRGLARRMRSRGGQINSSFPVASHVA